MLNQKLRKEARGESYKLKQENYGDKIGREDVYLQKCNISFPELPFSELGNTILMIVEAKRQLVDLSRQIGCEVNFADDLFIELALYKPQSHYDMIKLANVAQFDYNMSLDAFLSWIAKEQGFEVVEG